MATTTIKELTWRQKLDVLHALAKPPRRELLFGPAGTGKTTYAVSTSPDAERCTITAGMFADALFGKFLLAKGSTVWVDGPATRAARKGVTLILDELDHQTGEIESALRCVLDDPSVCRFNLDSGEQLIPAKGYRVIATMNGTPDILSDPLQDRFDVCLHCRTPAEGLLETLRPDSAAFIQNKMLNDPDTCHWTPQVSPRRLLAFDALREQGMSDAIAAGYAFGHKNGKVILNAIVDAARNKVAYSQPLSRGRCKSTFARKSRKGGKR
jgi:MoxR-like ATPase